MVFKNAYIWRLLILILIFSVGVFADEEVGIPYYGPKIELVDSAILSSDGESFYTLKEHLFTHWNLSPLKKLQQWSIPLPKIRPIPNVKNFRDVYVLEKEKKIIIISRDELVLYNLQSKKIEKKIPFKNLSHSIDGNMLYVARVDGPKDSNGKLTHYPYLYLDVWKVPELTKIKSTNLTKQSNHFKHHLFKRYDYETSEYYTPYEDSIFRYGGVIIMGESVIFFVTEEKKFAIIDKVSLNLKEVINRGAVRQTSDGYLILSRRYIIKQSDGSIILESFDEEDKIKKIQEFLNRPQGLPWFQIHIHSWSLIKQRQISNIKNLSLRFQSGGRYSFFITSKERMIARFYQYGDELLLRRTGSYNFEASSNNPKDYKMENSFGIIVPMNEATFKRYNKQLHIKANLWEH